MARKFKLYKPTKRRLANAKYGAVSPWYYKRGTQLLAGTYGALLGGATGYGGGVVGGWKTGWTAAGKGFTNKLYRKSRRRGTAVNGLWGAKGTYGVGSNTPKRINKPWERGSNPSRTIGSNTPKRGGFKVRLGLGLGLGRKMYGKKAHPSKWIRYG